VPRCGVQPQWVPCASRTARPSRNGCWPAVEPSGPECTPDWTPHRGTLSVRARMDLTPRSMASVWMVGLEDEPDRCGEICVFEVFGDAVEPGVSAAVGMGVHPFRDPALTDDFAAPRLELDVTEHHTYTAEWSDERVDFVVDGTRVRSVGQAPAYPMQMMVAVFDFPAHERAQAHAGHVPLLAVDRIEGH